ncbi:MAG: hypothetical protein ONB46_24815 [candidate division KSB1 bacterium]|nr:hypothetical protein [candidate division KSB1 bacterium]MDZ7369105.1 hypothetical protein [candidate division KSB1 bacterium]
MKLAQEYPAETVCQALRFPRSSFYYQALALDEQALEKAIDELAAAWPTYGYRRITGLFHPILEARLWSSLAF